MGVQNNKVWSEWVIQNDQGKSKRGKGPATNAKRQPIITITRYVGLKNKGKKRKAQSTLMKNDKPSPK